MTEVLRRSFRCSTVWVGTHRHWGRRGEPTGSVCVVQLYFRVLQETILVGFHLDDGVVSWHCQSQKWLCGELSLLVSCPSLSSKESTANCMLKCVCGHGKASVCITGPIWSFPSRRQCSQGSSQRCDFAVALQLTARFSCTVTFARLFSWWQASPLSTLGLLTEFPQSVFSSCVYWHLLYLLGIIRHPSKTHIYQGSQHAIAHPCHKSWCPTLSHDKSNCECTNLLINVRFGCFVSCFPGRLRSASFFSEEQNQSPCWLWGDFRLRAKNHLQQHHHCLSSSDFWQWLTVALLKLIVPGLKASWHQHRQDKALPKRSLQLIPWELAVPTLLSMAFRTERIYW